MACKYDDTIVRMSISLQTTILRRVYVTLWITSKAWQ